MEQLKRSNRKKRLTAWERRNVNRDFWTRLAEVVRSQRGGDFTQAFFTDVALERVVRGLTFSEPSRLWVNFLDLSDAKI